MNYEEPELN